MDVVLEVTTGVGAGQKVAVREGQTLTIGRTNKSDVAIPDDYMSGLHFAVECGPAGCRVMDRQSSNGTFLNEARIHESMVASGDKIRAGQSTFVVHFQKAGQVSPGMAAPSFAPPPTPSAPSAPAAPSYSPPAAPSFTPPSAPSRPAAPVEPAMPAFTPPSAPSAPVQPAMPSFTPQAPSVPSTPSRPSMSAPSFPAAQAPAPAAAVFSRPAVLKVGSWSFGLIPNGWQPTEGFGIQQDTKDGFPSSVVATEEQLFEGGTLQQFVEAQVTMLRQYLREPSFEAALPPSVPGADETVALDVRYSTKEGQSISYRRVYARAGNSVGVLTLTALEKDAVAARAAFSELLSEIAFTPPRAASAQR